MSDKSNRPASKSGTGGSSRRTFLIGTAAGVLFGGAGVAYGQQQQTEFKLKGDASGWVGVAPSSIEGQTNPTLELEAGTTYTVTWENADGAPHNFAIETASGEKPVSSSIMSQQGQIQTVEFTASEAMSEYLCEVHPESMRGTTQVGGGSGGGGGGGGQKRSATVTLEDQSTDGMSVKVASVTMSEGGFVAIHDSRLLDGDALGSVVGVSDYLESGTHEGVTVKLDEAPDDGETLIAMPHLDTNGNQAYDFVTSEGSEDGPYTDSDGAVTDDATVSVEGKTSQQFRAELTGENEVPPVDTEASGESHFMLSGDESQLKYEIQAQNLENAVAAHIHLGGPDENGPVVVSLFETGDAISCVDGLLEEGTTGSDDLTGPLEGENLDALISEMSNGNTYVNVHTEQNPPGEIRGQIESTDDTGGAKTETPEGTETETPETETPETPETETPETSG